MRVTQLVRENRLHPPFVGRDDRRAALVIGGFERRELRFIRRLYAGDLPVSRAAMDVVRSILIQPEGKVTNAAGEHAFAAPWPPGTRLSAKTGSGTANGQTVRWIVGHVAQDSRSWLFVSCVTGGADLPALAAVDQAAFALQDANVLR